jgi:pimeloyl-ACP methyl ester carboxylesterase
LRINDIELHIEDHGTGTPVLLLHGWPDSADLWRHQIPALTDAGFRAIAPDLRGFGRSDKPEGVDAYAFPVVLNDVLGILDQLGIDRAHIVGHDFGAALGWAMAMRAPERVDRLVVISVGHPAGPRSVEARSKAWYQLFNMFEGIAEQWWQYDDWALFREVFASHPEAERAIADLSRPGALTASLNWYRANLAPRPPGPPPEMPKVAAPTLGIWSTGDAFLNEDRMIASERFVDAEWRYERLDGVSHWIPLDVPDRLNELLLEWLSR